MSIDARSTRPRRFSTWVLGAGLLLSVGAAACKDPNPTFVFVDSGADGPKDAGATDGSGKGGGGGAGGAAGTAGTGGAAGAGGAGGGATGSGGTGGAAAGGTSGAGGAA
jgi:hypothetical protein